MQKLALTNANIILPDRVQENGVVLVNDQHIGGVLTEADAIPADYELRSVDGNYVSPGYIDLHVHGADGHDFMDGTVEAIQAVCAAHRAHGTTTIHPTSTTGSHEQVLAMIDACRLYRQSATANVNLPGIHLYGPFFAEDKVGCHSQSGRRSPTPTEYDRYFETDVVRIATCAAELPGALEFYRRAADAGCLITCGHSNCSWPEMQAAFDCGVRHVDHFWCAMSSVPSLRARFGTPMQASMAEFVLANSAMSTEVIADGFHLSPELLQFAYRMLPDRLCLVTDCNRAMGMPPGEYRFGNRDDGSWLKSDGQVGWAPDGASLASSIVGMDHMVQHMYRVSGASLPEVIRMASLTPARRAGIDDTTGSISSGKNADLLILDRDLNVVSSLVRGR